jgi:hypothetical protein
VQGSGCSIFMALSQHFLKEARKSTDFTILLMVVLLCLQDIPDNRKFAIINTVWLQIGRHKDIINGWCNLIFLLQVTVSLIQPNEGSDINESWKMTHTTFMFGRYDEVKMEAWSGWFNDTSSEMRWGEGHGSQKMKTATFPPKLLISVADYITVSTVPLQ